jgi:mRNA interferase RelE/StbE
MYNIFLSHSANKIYNNLSEADTRKINRSLTNIEKNPFYFPGKIARLKGNLEGKYRYKYGNWRIIYSVKKEEKEINIEVICLRGNAPYS